MTRPLRALLGVPIQVGEHTEAATACVTCECCDGDRQLRSSLQGSGSEPGPTFVTCVHQEMLRPHHGVQPMAAGVDELTHLP